MKKAILAFGMLFLTASAAQAWRTRNQTCIQCTETTVDAARSTTTRVGSSYAISGSGVNTTDGTTAGTISAGTISSGLLDPGTISATQATNGNSFSYSQSFTQGDAVPTAGSYCR